PGAPVVPRGPKLLVPAAEFVEVPLADADPASPAPHVGEPATDRRQKTRHPDTDRRRVPRSAKAHLFVTVCHWSMVALLTLNLLSGMRIGWAYHDSALGGMHGPWATLLRTM